MLQVMIIAVGKCREQYFSGACKEYVKRLSAFCKPEILEVEEHRLPSNPSKAQIQKCLSEEGRAILAKIPVKARIIALCVEGRALTSQQLADELASAGQDTSCVAFVIGGSHGLSDEVKRAAGLRLSLSAMTLPHQLARVVLIEQAYRAFSINANLKYHK